MRVAILGAYAQTHSHFGRRQARHGVVSRAVVNGLLVTQSTAAGEAQCLPTLEHILQDSGNA